MKTQGQRTYPEPPHGVHDCAPGDYFQDERGDWRGKTPNGFCIWLKNHTVVESTDGTITVSPSILVNTSNGRVMWHGFLKAGVWEEC